MPNEWSEGAVETINRPVRVARWALLLAFAFALSAAAFVACVQMDRSVEGDAVVRPEGGAWGAQAPWAGTVTEVLVEEGARVKAGDPLFRMDLKELEIRRSGLLAQKSIAEQDLESRRRRATQVREQGDLAQQSGLLKLERAQANRAKSRSDAALAKAQVEARLMLAEKKLVSTMELTEAKARQEAMEALLAASEKDVELAGREQEFSQRNARRDDEEQASAVLAAARSLGELDSQLEDLARKAAEGTVRSACDGTAMRKVARAPQVVAAGAALADVVPAGAPPVLEVRVEASEAADVVEGQRARVRFSGRSEPVGGRVRRVAADAEKESDRSFYKVLVGLDASPEPIPFGLQGRALLVTRRATLLQFAREWFEEVREGRRVRARGRTGP